MVVALGWLANLLPDLTAEGESVGAGIARGMAAAIDAITAVVEFIRNFSLADAGRALIDTFVSGIVAGKDRLIQQAKDVLGGVRDLLPFSDARIGPLSRLTQSGRAIVTTIAEGVRSAPPLKEALLAGALTLPPLGSPDISLPTLTAEALAPPLPVGPVPPPAAAGRVEISLNMAEGAIVINATGDDAEGIATRVGGELENWSRGLVEQLDSRFKA